MAEEAPVGFTLTLRNAAAVDTAPASLHVCDFVPGKWACTPKPRTRAGKTRLWIMSILVRPV